MVMQRFPFEQARTGLDAFSRFVDKVAPWSSLERFNVPGGGGIPALNPLPDLLTQISRILPQSPNDERRRIEEERRRMQLSRMFYSRRPEMTPEESVNRTQDLFKQYFIAAGGGMPPSDRPPVRYGAGGSLPSDSVLAPSSYVQRLRDRSPGLGRY